MDNVIFEDPSKQRPRLIRPSRGQTIEVAANQNNPAQGERVPSQRLDASGFDLGGSGMSYGSSTKYIDGDQSGHVHGSSYRSGFDPAGATASSMLELFSMSEDDRCSIDEGSPSQLDSLFSSPEPEGSTKGSNTSVTSTVDKRGEAATPGPLDSSNRTFQGIDPDVAIVLEDDVLDGDAANWATFQNEMFESQVGGPAWRIRRSATDREENAIVEPCTGSDNKERDDNARHATTARNDRQHSGHIQREGRTGRVSLSNHSHRTDAARVVGGFQLSTSNDSRRYTQQTTSPTFPLSRKRHRLALPESPFKGLDVSDDQSFGRKKASRSRSFQSRRATQNGLPVAAIGSHSEFLLPGHESRSVSDGLPSSLDEGPHDAEKEVVWEYMCLLDYQIIDGKPLVLVPWIPTWEPRDEYPEEEVDRVRRQYQAIMQGGRRRGRPRSKQHF